MKLLLDTHLLLWAAGQPSRLSARARRLITDEKNEIYFSAASLWEITIKVGLGRGDLKVEPTVLRRALLDNGYAELPITSQHAVSTAALPPLHRDPFDRVLLAQASCEGFVLLTADNVLASYPGPVRKV